jgi:2-polyprenyl-3-methyl-5-hydroxy-6-metoxy-1,4-benzoquinol methylase
LLADIDQVGLRYEHEILPSKVNVANVTQAMVEFMLERSVTTEERSQVDKYLRDKQHQELQHPLLAIRIHSALSADEYHDIYNSFRDATDTIAVVNEWSKQILPSILRHPVRNMLSVGCGNGKMDSFNFLSQIDGIQSYTGLDRSAVQLSDAGLMLAKHSNVQVTLSEGAYQDFRTDAKYDLIVISHVLYYIPERLFVLSKACSMLS